MRYDANVKANCQLSQVCDCNTIRCDQYRAVLACLSCGDIAVEVVGLLGLKQQQSRQPGCCGGR